MTRIKLSLIAAPAIAIGLVCGIAAPARAVDAKTQRVISRGLEWLANNQSSRGGWSVGEGRYPTAMTALAGHGPAVRRLDHHARQVRRRTSARPSITWSAAAAPTA